MASRLNARLQNLEAAAARAAEFDHQRFMQAQREFGLPLPSGSDLNEGLRRLQDCLARCKSATFEEQQEILGEFRAWVDSEHERCKA